MHDPLTVAFEIRYPWTKYRFGRPQMILSAPIEKASSLAQRPTSVCSNQGASYAEICFEPTTYHAVYWIWRAIKFMSRKKGWRFGDGRNVLTAAEL